LTGLRTLDPATIQRVLFLTVGGSWAPLVMSLKHHAPDYVVFVCSAADPTSGTRSSSALVVGEGHHVGESPDRANPSFPNIRIQANLEHVPFDLLELPRIDDLETCHAEILAAFQAVREALPGVHVVADYTGGTKTMAAALAAVAVEDGLGRIAVVTGARSNLERVADGTSTALVWHPWGMQARRRFDREVGPLMATYDYAGIRHLLNDLTRDELPDDLHACVQLTMALCNGFEAWDRFDHLEALRILGLGHLREGLGDHVRFLEQVCHSRSAVDPEFPEMEAVRDTQASGFEIVDDLLLNAGRCATRERYDDAVGRLYRATELFVQIHLLRTYGIRTGDLDLARLPEAARTGWRPSPTGKFQTGLRGAYELLRHFPDDPVGRIYTDPTTRLGERLMTAIQIRNQSLFAHGFRPLGPADHRSVADAVASFLDAAMAALQPCRPVSRGLPFPTDLLAGFRIGQVARQRPDKNAPNMIDL